MTLTLTLPLGEKIYTGRQVTFEAPCSSEGLTGLIVEGVTYDLVNALGTPLVSNSFDSGAMVSVIFNAEKLKAYVQNADTNAYLEGKFNDVGGSATSHINNKNNPHGVTAKQVGAATEEYAEGKANYAYRKVISMGEQLVINGNGYLKDSTNFYRLEFDSSKKNNSFGSFKNPTATGYGSWSDLMPIDPEKDYIFSVDATTKNGLGTLFSSFRYYDADGNELGYSGYKGAQADVPPVDSWATYTAILKASDRPEGTVQIAINWLVNHTSQDDYVWITNVSIVPINPYNVTASQVGLGNVPNVATNDQTPTYSDITTLATLTSGEKLSVAFQKIKLAITNLINHIGNKNNPHAVTASQVGAAASSHTHSKSEISDFPTSIAPTAHTHSKTEITDFPSSMTPSSHIHAASDIKAGTFADTGVIAKTGTDYTTYRIRNIAANTTDMTAKSSALTNGNIYFQYE